MTSSSPAAASPPSATASVPDPLHPGPVALALVSISLVAMGVTTWACVDAVDHLQRTTAQVAGLERLQMVLDHPLDAMKTMLLQPDVLLEPLRQLRLDIEGERMARILGTGAFGLAMAAAVAALGVVVIRFRRSAWPLSSWPALGWVLLLLAAGFLVTGLTAPAMSIATVGTIPCLGQLLVALEAKNGLSLVRHLITAHEYLLGGMLLLFSVLMPAAKLVATGIILVSPATAPRPLLGLVYVLGRWSFADVIVVSVLLALLARGQAGFTDAWAEAGIILFGLHGVCASLAAGVALRGVIRCQAAGHVPWRPLL